MIPPNIRREHIIDAIMEADQLTIPPERLSKKFLLEYAGRHYPPKFIISIANRYANDVELDSNLFSGGKESNNFLNSRGFNVLGIGSEGGSVKKPSPQIIHNSVKARKENIHNQRCPDCKNAVRLMLQRIYGKVETNYSFDIGTQPDDFANLTCFSDLKKVYDTLQEQRGFTDFIRAKRLPACDFYIPDPRFILEFDETQHFTPLRQVSLGLYPESIEYGFDRERWKDLCGKIKAKDNDPPYRDEQRAWYDTLRDFLPQLIPGLKSTVRLFAKDHKWCDLDHNNSEDVAFFKQLIANKISDSWRIRIRKDPNPFLARMIIADEWIGDRDEAKRLLSAVCNCWPDGVKVKFLITCGGFIQFPWPVGISRKDIGDNLNPDKASLERLIHEAKIHIECIFNSATMNQLRGKADYLTIGIDSFKEKISTTKNHIGKPHVELVFLIDLKNGNIHHCGKSYPTPSQQRGLVRYTDLSSHFFADDDLKKILILGCHDLAIFNPRSINAKEWRAETNRNFRILVSKERPSYVLHHPHTTVKRRTWLNSWNQLNRMLPDMKGYAGAGRYFESDRPVSQWDNLEDVLRSTKKGGSIDFILSRER